MTDEDKTLLEMAAKAAGLQYIKPAEGYSGSLGLEVGSDNPMRCYLWNPLEDDGDALRLAVKLKIDIDQRVAEPRVAAIAAMQSPKIESVADEKQRQAATRRAVVRAAAEIGKVQQ